MRDATEPPQQRAIPGAADCYVPEQPRRRRSDLLPGPAPARSPLDHPEQQRYKGSRRQILHDATGNVCTQSVQELGWLEEWGDLFVIPFLDCVFEQGRQFWETDLEKLIILFVQHVELASCGGCDVCGHRSFVKQ
eukprot:6372790-Prymnesium_polylepis.2